MNKNRFPEGRRLPVWFRQNIPDANVLAIFNYLKRRRVNTVCQQARCPNWSRCISRGNIAFMILGNYCTRSCLFCAVEKSQNKSLPLDEQEPYRLLQIIKDLRMNYAIITSVTRDDLPDFGAGQFVRIINLIREYNEEIKIEVLIPEFLGLNLTQVVLAEPDVLAHNVETVPNLYPKIRKQACYQRSLNILSQAKRINPCLITKSSLLLGMGEKESEVIGVMYDLVEAGCDILVLGQYLAPGPIHYPVQEFISIKQFKRYKDRAVNIGFREVVASPLARTSYQAEKVFNSVKRRAYSVY
jgi:lipoic acid synthetase